MTSRALSANPVPNLSGGTNKAPQRKSVAHRLALTLVWVTVCSGFFVFSEPAPIDALTFGLIILLPVIGLFDAKRGVVGAYALWLIVGAGLAIGCVFARDTGESSMHSLVSFYLYGSCFLFAGFIAKNPVAHGRLVMNAYYASTLIGAAIAVIGYLDLLPGAGDMLTRYGRASGTFKDPNVLGPFLIPGLLMSLHLILVRPLRSALLPVLGAGLITTALLFTFSRGAWAISAVAVGIYLSFYLYSAERDMQRLKVAGLVMMTAALLALVLAAALQSEAVSDLFSQRATLDQSYDAGPDGRFGGQRKAFDVILENPFGIGSHAFTHYYHHEEAHNVYLSMFMDAGWLGGFAYLLICIGTIGLGWRHAAVRTRTQYLFVIAYASLVGIILEGAIIDTYHWRSFYILLGVVWGLMASDTRPERKARELRDVRPALLKSLLLVPPSMRSNRIVSELPQLKPQRSTRIIRLIAVDDKCAVAQRQARILRAVA